MEKTGYGSFWSYQKDLEAHAARELPRDNQSVPNGRTGQCKKRMGGPYCQSHKGKGRLPAGDCGVSFGRS